MANEQNLRKLSPSEAREQGRKGGKASGKARREKKQLRECLEELLATSVSMADGRKVDGATAISMKLFQNALNGDVKSFQVLRDTIGQMPIQKIETVNIPPEAYERVSRVLDGLDGGE